LSGIVNTVLIVREYKFDGPYHPLLGVKILLALAIFYIASMLAGRSEAAERFRQKAPFWLNVNLFLSILLICIAVWMRLIDRIEKTETGRSPQSAIEAVADRNLARAARLVRIT
jgi:hypothetical protein